MSRFSRARYELASTEFALAIAWEQLDAMTGGRASVLSANAIQENPEQ